MNKQSTNSYDLTFGHYIGREFEQSPFRAPPGKILVKENYRIQFEEIIRPKEGATKFSVTCDICGEKFQFEVRSTRHILAHYFKIFGMTLIVAVPCSIATYFMGGYPSIVFFIALFVLLLVFELPEIFGSIDHHSPIVPVDSLSGHKLFWVHKAKQDT